MIYKSIANFLILIERPAWFFMIAVLYRISLEIGYYEFVNPVFSYSGFILDVDVIKYLESWLIFLFLFFLFPKTLAKVSDYLLAYMLFAFLAPLLVFYAMTNADRGHLYIVLMSVGLILLFRFGKPFRIPVIMNGRLIGNIVILTGIIVVTVWMLYSGGLNFFNLDLTKVYTYRDNVGGLIDKGPMGYLNVWATKVFGPIFLALSLWKKRYFLAALIFLLHIVWFGISAHKSVLFYPLLVVFLWMWSARSKALAIIPLGMMLAIFVSLVIFFVFSDVFVGSLFVRRVFFVPSHLTFTYFEFFSQNQFVYWSNSITSQLMDYPYEMNPAKLIGTYLGTNASANNSFLSTGYMHAGILGMVFYGIAVGGLFRLIDSLAYKGVPPWVAVASLIVPSHSLIMSADLPTSLLTHGIGMAMVILFLLRATQNNYTKPMCHQLTLKPC